VPSGTIDSNGYKMSCIDIIKSHQISKMITGFYMDSFDSFFSSPFDPRYYRQPRPTRYNSDDEDDCPLFAAPMMGQQPTSRQPSYQQRHYYNNHVLPLYGSSCRTQALGREAPARRKIPVNDNRNHLRQRQNSQYRKNITISCPQRQHRSKHKQTLQQWNNAATIIQRAYRAHRLRRQDQAARILQRFFRQLLIRSEFDQHIRPAINQVQRIQQDLQNVQREYVEELQVFVKPLVRDSNGCVAYVPENRPLLAYEDTLTHLMLKVDAVESFGEEAVREWRKTLVRRIQKLLDTVDSFKHQIVEDSEDDCWESDDMEDIWQWMYGNE
jgi:hypothetical protein